MGQGTCYSPYLLRFHCLLSLLFSFSPQPPVSQPLFFFFDSYFLTLPLQGGCNFPGSINWCILCWDCWCCRVSFPPSTFPPISILVFSFTKKSRTSRTYLYIRYYIGKRVHYTGDLSFAAGVCLLCFMFHYYWH